MSNSIVQQIKENNKSNAIDQAELKELISKANAVFKENWSSDVFFERSVFINWTCAIADCKYCYLSTKPKYKPAEGTKAYRSRESILAEVLICKLMGWKVGYITGGLRVESTEQLIQLANDIEKVLGHKTMMNFGPYSNAIVEKFKPHILGMGSAIESFDEELHNFICPSKPLRSLMMFLESLQKNNMKKLITIILGLGEKKEHVETVIENIRKFGIDKVQLCFLKPQENTVFDDVPPPNIPYMAWWAAKIRIACPTVQINVALVKERIEDMSLLLEAGVNNVTRFLVFSDFGSDLALQLEKECVKAGRVLRGNFTSIPDFDLKEEVMKLDFDLEFKEKILSKVQQYYKRLRKLEK